MSVSGRGVPVTNSSTSAVYEAPEGFRWTA